MDITSLQNQVNELKASIQALTNEFYKNNFVNRQVFNKECIFNSRLKVPHYTSAPSISEVGDLIEIGGKLYICTVANTTWTLVGSQI